MGGGTGRAGNPFFSFGFFGLQPVRGGETRPEQQRHRTNLEALRSDRRTLPLQRKSSSYLKLLFFGGGFPPFSWCFWGIVRAPVGETLLVLARPSRIHCLAPAPPVRGIPALLRGLALPNLLLALCSPDFLLPPVPLTVIYVCKDLKCFSPSSSAHIRDATHWKGESRACSGQAAKASLCACLVTLCWTERCREGEKCGFFQRFSSSSSSWTRAGAAGKPHSHTLCSSGRVPTLPGCSSRGLQASASLMLGITWSSSPRAGNALPLPKGLGGSLFPFQASLGCVLP